MTNLTKTIDMPDGWIENPKTKEVKPTSLPVGLWVKTLKTLGNKLRFNLITLTPELNGVPFQPDDLEGYDDLFSNCVLYEADRIREGEWDRFYNRWSSKNYIRCFVVLSRTPIYGVEEQGLVSGRLVINKGKTPSTDERIKRFPNTWNSDGTMRYGEEWIQGAIEFDPSLLKTVELLCDEENIERAKKTGKKGEIKEGNGKGLGCFERTMWWKRSDFDKYVDRKLRRRGTRRINKKGYS